MRDSDGGTRRLGFEPGLDGIRGIAVLVVVAWHFTADVFDGGTPSWFPSGHVGVDVFFVLSGFLITALMLGEHDRAETISFRGFYRRRAYRLLPALAFFLLGHIMFALLVDVDPGPFTAGITLEIEIASVLTTAFFALNWIHEFGQPAADGLRHLWSLSVEEQFYIVWPAVTVLLVGQAPARSWILDAVGGISLAIACQQYYWSGSEPALRMLGIVAVAATATYALGRLRRRDQELGQYAFLGALIAAVLIYRLAFSNDVSRQFGLYTNTFSRADSLIIGALLAFLWCKGRIPRRAPVPLAVLGWGIIVWSITQRALGEQYFFTHGWTLIAIGSALVVWGAIDADETFLGQVLSMPWLRAIGRVAYGLYLWHVLIIVIVRNTMGDESAWLKGAVCIAGITAAVTFSWFVIEKPIMARRDRTRTAVAVK